MPNSRRYAPIACAPPESVRGLNRNNCAESFGFTARFRRNTQ
jgi:hypothetical protein